MKLKPGDIEVQTKGDLLAMVWRNKREVHMLTSIHNPPAEGIFCDEKGNAVKTVCAIIIVT
jgi:hypothetical protein